MSPNRFKSLAALIVALIVTLDVHAQRTNARHTTLTPRQIAQRSLPSVVVLFAEDVGGHRFSLGTGFFVDKNVIATNYHVIQHAARVSAKSVTQRKEFPIKEIIGFDEKKDLALLMVEGISVRPLPLGDVTKLAIGDDVYVAGNPEGFEGTFSQGIISGFRGSRYIQITAPLSHGSSGGPVLNKRGEVIGVAVGLIQEGQNLNFAISASELLGFQKDAMRRYKQLKGLKLDLSGIDLSSIDEFPRDAPKEASPVPPSTPQKGIEWEVVALTDDSIFLINVNRIRTDEGTVKVWVKTILLKEEDKQKGKQISLNEYEGSPHVVVLIEYDCKKEMMRTNFIAEYGEKGELSASGTIKDEWKNIPPDTIAHAWFVAACKK
jgi:hypothetical protein